VRIHGRTHIVGDMTGSGRSFTAADDGTQISLSFGRQLEMARREELISDARYKALTPSVLTNLRRDWGAFTESQRLEAMATSGPSPTYPLRVAIRGGSSYPPSQRRHRVNPGG